MKKKKYATGGSIFAGSGIAGLDDAINKIDSDAKKNIDSINDTYVKPNKGWAGALKAGKGLLNYAASSAGAAAGVASGNAAAAAGAPMPWEAGEAIADVIKEREKGEKMIRDIELQSEKEQNRIKSEKTKKLSAVIAGQSEYKDGGKIVGPGTGKSDSINANAETGAFIVPAENAKKAMEIGQKALGWEASQRASLSDGDVKGIKLSNGEVMFTREEAQALRKSGYDIDSLAPKGNNMAKKYNIGTNFLKDLSTEDKMAYGASAAQIIGGIAVGAQKDKGLPELKRTDLNKLGSVGSGYSNLAQKIKDRAVRAVNYMKSAVTKGSNQTFASEQQALAEKSGGDSAAYLKAMGGAGNRRNAAIVEGQGKAAEMLADTEAKAGSIEAEGLKSRDNAKLASVQLAARENELEYQSKTQYNTKMDEAKASAAASLISAGIANSIGYTDSKNQAKIRAEREENSKVKYEGKSEVDANKLTELEAKTAKKDYLGQISADQIDAKFINPNQNRSTAKKKKSRWDNNKGI